MGQKTPPTLCSSALGTPGSGSWFVFSQVSLSQRWRGLQFAFSALDRGCRRFVAAVSVHVFQIGFCITWRRSDLGRALCTGRCSGAPSGTLARCVASLLLSRGCVHILGGVCCRGRRCVVSIAVTPAALPVDVFLSRISVAVFIRRRFIQRSPRWPAIGLSAAWLAVGRCRRGCRTSSPRG